MIKVNIYGTGLVFDIPQSIDDVTPEMAEIIGELVWMEVEPIEKAVLFFTKVAKLKYLHSDKSINWDLLGAQIIQHELISSILFLFQDDVTDNIIPSLKINGVEFIGPLKEMENIRVLEWVKADEL